MQYNGLPIEELARRQAVRPIVSLDEPGLWDSDQDHEAFLTDLYASRRSDVA